MSQSYSAGRSTSFDQTLGQMKSANQDFLNGDPVPIMELWSTAADVTILGEGGGYGLGWEQVGPILLAGASLFDSGHRAADRIAYASRHGPVEGSGPGSVEKSGHSEVDFIAHGISVGGDVAYTVGIERGEACMPGDDEPQEVVLRVTTLYRWEASRWKIVHRHADALVERR